ncbi:MAG: helix-turn-helix domain-containing protein [Methylococcaceae bacterium]|nr:helix-turn-helix domain-containing protein [Methylococcaceae bacterium]
MSIDASRWAWTQQITPSQKIVLLSLADRADEEGYCYPSVKRLELDCSMTRRTIQRNLSELEALKLIERKSRFTGSGQTSNDFFLIGIVDRHGENTPKTNRSGRRKPIESMDSSHATSDTPPAPPVTPRTAIESSFNHKKKQQRAAEKTAKPKPISSFLPKSTLAVKPDSEDDIKRKDAIRIETIAVFVSRHKAEYLQQFKTKRHVVINGIGVVIEPDLKAAGLFD